jgi:hypothetical protein
VTKTVYITERGWLNSLAILSFGMLSCLIGTLVFRKISRIKHSESYTYTTKMCSNGFYTMFVSSALVSGLCFLVFYNTYPDSIAVYNPFEREISLRGVTYSDSFF